MPLYASDVLEPLLGAAASRRAVRDHCLELLRDTVEPKLQRRLTDVAWYIGGKCMGYPAIWLLALVFEPRGVTLPVLIERCEPALSVSLTTSIVDDLMDRDEPINEEHVGLLYVLLSHASYGAPASPIAAAEQRAHLNRALEVCSAAAASEDAHERRGDRIGHFFRMIAAAGAASSLPASEASVLTEAAGVFGRFCAHLDDWIDLERDCERGENSNVALQLLRGLRKTRGGEARIEAAEMPMLRERMESLLAEQLRACGSLLASLGPALAPSALDRVAQRLRAGLAAIEPRQSVYARS